MYLAVLGLSCGARQLPASFLHVGARSPSRDQAQGRGSQPLDRQGVPGLTGGCEWAPHVLRLLRWLHQEQAWEEGQRKKETASLLWPVTPPAPASAAALCPQKHAAGPAHTQRERLTQELDGRGHAALGGDSEGCLPPEALTAKGPPASAGESETGLQSLLRKVPWRRAWPPTPAVLPGESQDRGARWSTFRGVPKSQTGLK